MFHVAGSRPHPPLSGWSQRPSYCAPPVLEPTPLSSPSSTWALPDRTAPIPLFPHVPPTTKGAPSDPLLSFRPVASFLHSTRVPPSLHFPTELVHVVLRSPEPLPPWKFELPPPPWPHRGELPSPIARFQIPCASPPSTTAQQTTFESSAGLVWRRG
jgi:hypothetical protein